MMVWDVLEDVLREGDMCGSIVSGRVGCVATFVHVAAADVVVRVVGVVLRALHQGLGGGRLPSTAGGQ